MLVTRVAQRLSSTAVFEAMIRPTPALAASLLLGCALAATAADLTPGATATTPLSCSSNCAGANTPCPMKSATKRVAGRW